MWGIFVVVCLVLFGFLVVGLGFFGEGVVVVRFFSLLGMAGEGRVDEIKEKDQINCLF